MKLPRGQTSRGLITVLTVLAVFVRATAGPALRGEPQLPVLQFLQPTNSAIFSTMDEIPILLRAFAPNDVFPTAEVLANQTKIATVSYCCTLCPCAAPFPGREMTLQIPVPWNGTTPPGRTWQGWTNVQAGIYRDRKSVV